MVVIPSGTKEAILTLLLLSSATKSFLHNPSTLHSQRPRYPYANTLEGSREALEGKYYIAKNETSSHAFTQYTRNDRLSIDDEDSQQTTFLEQELLDGYLLHQKLLLDALNDNGLERREKSVIFYEEPQVLKNSSYTTNITLIPTDLAENERSQSFFLSDVWKARLLLLSSAALYGTNFSVVKQLDELIPNIGVSSTLRFGLAALAMFPMLVAPLSKDCKNSVKSSTTYAFMEPSRFSIGLAGMEIGLWNSVGYISQAVGLRTTAASTSAFVCSMAVVTVPILDCLFGRPLLRRQIIGAAMAAFGVWALEMGQDLSSFTSDNIATLIQPIMFGLGFWRMEAAMEKFPTEAARLASGQLFMVFLASLSYLVCWSTGDDLMLQDACSMLPTIDDIAFWLSDSSILGLLIWTGLVTTAFTIYMETLALKTLSAAETTLIFSTEPLFGAAFAAVVANECLTEGGWIGSALIISGCIVSGIDWSQHFRRCEVNMNDWIL